MIDVEAIIKYYVDLLIVQYHDKPKARAVIDELVREVIADGILFKVRDGYSIDTAIGVQLDILGKYVGVTRDFSLQDFDGYFAFTTYTEVTPPTTKRGFTTYAEYETKTGKWLQYFDVLSDTYKLGDEDYRFLIRLKIV